MRHSWDEAKPPAVKHPADIVARSRVSGRGTGVPLSVQTRSGCRETLTSVARDRLSQGKCLKVSQCQGEQFLGSSIRRSFRLTFRRVRLLIDFRHGVAALATSGGIIGSPVISLNRYDQEQ